MGKLPNLLTNAIANSLPRERVFLSDNIEIVNLSLRSGDKIPREIHDVTQIFILLIGKVIIITKGASEDNFNAETLEEGDGFSVLPNTYHEVIAVDESRLITFYAPKE